MSASEQATTQSEECQKPFHGEQVAEFRIEAHYTIVSGRSQPLLTILKLKKTLTKQNCTMIIDFHTHAFPDAVAAKALPALEKIGNIKAHSNGTVDGLLASMDGAGIEHSVICSIATRPEQFSAIVEWSQQIRSDRLTPLASIHPDDPDGVEKVYQLHKLGFPGIKMHPYYQNFFLNEQRMQPLYDALSETGLFLVPHCGYDIGFPRTRCADPAKILELHRNFPRLQLIATHFGGWKLWDEVEDMLIGRNIFMEISFALKYLSREQIKRMLNKHPSDYLLFGSDSPWDDQSESIRQLEKLHLNDTLFSAILGGNAEKLL